MAPQIIRYYLHESPILPTIRTYWLGTSTSSRWSSRTRTDTASGRFLPRIFAGRCRSRRRRSRGRCASSPAITSRSRSKAAGEEEADLEQDHIVFALRHGEDQYEVFPGALTRVFSRRTESTDWISKDSWVPALSQQAEAAQTWTRNALEIHHPSARGHQPRGGILLLDGPLPRARLSPGLPDPGYRDARKRGTQRRRTQALPPNVEPAAAAARNRRRREPAQHHHPRRTATGWSCLPEPGTVVRTFDAGDGQRGIHPRIAEPGGARHPQPAARSLPPDALPRKPPGGGVRPDRAHG